MIPSIDPAHAPMDAVLSLQTYGAGGDASLACGGQGYPDTTCCWTNGCPPPNTIGCVTNGCTELPASGAD
ncbi:MAG TPA: hypothetical protein VEQ60_10755 [Longimicrobium sp.]|nr:hypothetical protein [Longimicrobium sp.]